MSFDERKFCEIYFNCWANAMQDGAVNKYNLTSKAWTAFHMEKILYPLAENLMVRENNYKTRQCPEKESSSCPKNCDCMYEKSWAQEYYRVDLSLYYYPENEIGWCPDFFIEHENEHFEIDTNRTIKNKGWYGEFIKLLPLKCSDLGAKVIISYDDFKNLTNKVDFLCKVLNSEDSICRQSITDTPILIILGPSNKTIKEDSDVDFKIVLFTCKNGKWDCKCQTSVEMLGNSSIKGIFQRIHKEYKQ